MDLTSMLNQALASGAATQSQPGAPAAPSMPPGMPPMPGSAPPAAPGIPPGYAPPPAAPVGAPPGVPNTAAPAGVPGQIPVSQCVPGNIYGMPEGPVLKCEGIMATGGFFTSPQGTPTMRQLTDLVRDYTSDPTARANFKLPPLGGVVPPDMPAHSAPQPPPVPQGAPAGFSPPPLPPGMPPAAPQPQPGNAPLPTGVSLPLNTPGINPAIVAQAQAQGAIGVTLMTSGHVIYDMPNAPPQGSTQPPAAPPLPGTQPPATEQPKKKGGRKPKNADGSTPPASPIPADGLVLLVNCNAEGARDLTSFVAELAAEVATSGKIFDVRNAPADHVLAFGRWKGVIAQLALQKNVTGLCAIHSSELADPVIEALAGAADLVVRGR